MQQSKTSRKDESPDKMDDSPSPQKQQLEESFDFLVSKHLIPPPLMLLPKPIYHKPKSLTPMIPLPSFVGIIPNFQPLDQPIAPKLVENDSMFNWIGEAFDNVVYKKYEDQSYMKIDNLEENWNIWACDVGKLGKKTSASDEPEPSPLTSFYSPKSIDDNTLIFESRFECGNLSMASKVTENQYNLLLQNDINTNGYSQWFFFKTGNLKKNQTVKFNILNHYKQNNLYKMGMKIIIYSKRQSEEKNISWHRGGQKICYYENGYSRSSLDYRPYFTLSWDYTCNYEDDQVYFAYSYPYTYSNLESLFSKIQSDPQLRYICQRTSLCKTLAGNHVDLLTITESHPFMEIDKGYIIITARIHPGQSVSSFVCSGIIEFLLSNNEKAKKLRQHFIFKIVPMLNPDGVIHGNYRSNISGYDLNKKWVNPSKIYHPEIYYLKKLILNIQQTGDILLFCDLHGHSMKKNAFVYGCHNNNSKRQGKQFPLLISRLFKGFSFKDCSFMDVEQEEGTARTFLSKQLNHCNIYALESSFCGPEYENIHFTVRHFEDLGEKFCEAILITFRQTLKQKQVEAAMKEKSFFPSKDSSFDSYPQHDSLTNFDELDLEALSEKVNSENSQLSQQEDELKTILQEKTVKKYLMMKFMRPQTTMRRGNIHIRKTYSKDLNKMKLADFLPKSNSPVKRRELYETPAKPTEKPKITLKFVQEKKEVQQKVFEAIDMLPLADRKKTRSVSKLAYQSEKIKGEKSSIKVVFNRGSGEIKRERQQDFETVFRNPYLRGLPKQDKQELKRNDFIIKKKIPHTDEKNTVSLFNSVLSSLRKDRK